MPDKMTAQEAMDKLNEWRKKGHVLTLYHGQTYGWYLWVVVACGIQCECGDRCKRASKFWGAGWLPDLTDAVAEVAEKMEKDLGK